MNNDGEFVEFDLFKTVRFESIYLLIKFCGTRVKRVRIILCENYDYVLLNLIMVKLVRKYNRCILIFHT